MISRILLDRTFTAAKRTMLLAITIYPSITISVIIMAFAPLAISRSPQEGASGCTTVDSGGAFRGCFQCWCSAARYCIVYNNIYSDVYSRCCARCSLTQHVSVNASTYTHIQIVHARARVLRECYVLSRSRIVRKSGCLCSLESVHKGPQGLRRWRAPRDARTRCRVRSRVALRDSAGCVYACVVGAREVINVKHTMPARLASFLHVIFAKCPCTHTYTVYILNTM